VHENDIILRSQFRQHQLTMWPRTVINHECCTMLGWPVIRYACWCSVPWTVTTNL